MQDYESHKDRQLDTLQLIGNSVLSVEMAADIDACIILAA